MKGVVLLLAAVVATLSVLVGVQFHNATTARVNSCRFTYEGVRLVFQPFFRPVSQRTPKEQRDIDKFNHRIDVLKAGCGKQTSHNH